MRIGTWNLAGRWSDEHRSLMLDADCDVWLLTKVNERTSLPWYAGTSPRRAWHLAAAGPGSPVGSR